MVPAGVTQYVFVLTLRIYRFTSFISLLTECGFQNPSGRPHLCSVNQMKQSQKVALKNRPQNFLFENSLPHTFLAHSFSLPQIFADSC